MNPLDLWTGSRAGVYLSRCIDQRITVSTSCAAAGGWQWAVLTFMLAYGLGLGCGDSKVTNSEPIQRGRPIPSYVEPIWSPDGSHIMFNHTPLESIYFDAQGQSHYVFAESLAGFWTIGADGMNQQRVSSQSLEEPAWGPDGQWIAFVQSADIWKVGVMGAGLDTTSFRRLTFQGFYFGPAWNPSATSLTFYRPTGPIVTGLYRINAGGGAPEHFGENGWSDPNVSPDGAHVLFVGPRDGKTAVGITDTTGANVTWIHDGIAPRLPKWSPDASRIAFMDRDPVTQVNHLWLMNADGAEVRKVTAHAVGSGFSWSPDGERIVFARFSFTEHTYENGTLWIARLSDGMVHQLTFSGPDAP